MKTKTVKEPVQQDPVSREEARQDKFFNRTLASIPKQASLICAKGVFAKGERSVTYTYRHAGRVYSTTLSTRKGVIA